MMKLLAGEAGHLPEEQYGNSQYQKHVQTNGKPETSTKANVVLGKVSFWWHPEITYFSSISPSKL